MDFKSKAPAVDKAFKIARYIAQLGEASASELSLHTDCPLNTVYRILEEMERGDYVVKREGKYCLGSGFYYLGKAAEHNVDIRTKAYPFIKELAECLKETVHLTCLKGDRMLLIEQVQTSNNIKIYVENNSVLYPHASAFGKCLLAYQSDAFLKVYAERSMLKLTKKTIADCKSLFDELAWVRKNKYAVDMEEYLDGVVCIGSPVFDGGGCVAALGVMLPHYRYNNSFKSVAVLKIKEAAKSLSEKLGGNFDL